LAIDLLRPLSFPLLPVGLGIWIDAEESQLYIVEGVISGWKWVVNMFERKPPVGAVGVF
jgi:hypothetical protein